MKIGIIVHSHTGNTLKVAEKIRDKLAEKGQDAIVLRVSAEDEKARSNIVLRDKPDTDSFDTLIFGAPVWAFSVSPVMKQYFAELNSLKGKKVACFVTQGGSPWFGGNRSIRQMVEFCRKKGAKAEMTEIIGWRGENLDQRIDSAAKSLSGIAK